MLSRIQLFEEKEEFAVVNPICHITQRSTESPRAETNGDDEHTHMGPDQVAFRLYADSENLGCGEADDTIEAASIAATDLELFCHCFFRASNPEICCSGIVRTLSYYSN